MAKLHRVLFLLSLLVSLSAFAQSADQAIVSATDSPDPVVPGNNITYTIQMQNNGPNPAVNGGVNANLDGALSLVSASGPAGFTCSSFGNAVSCTNPSWAPGSATFTIVANAPASLLNFPDGSFTSTFSPSGVTPDPTPGNNNASVTTNFDSPQVDLSLSVTDSPDPVFPNGNITYTIPVTNAGPNSATNVNFNTFNNGTLKFVSASAPAGWNCTLPAVGGNPTFTCTTATFAPSTVNFTVVVNADPAILGVNDGTVSTFFGVNGTGNDTNQNNNSETENTAYVTPDADMAITVSDSPDPVFPNGNITYTVQVTNNGPDTATNAAMNTFNNGTLKFVSGTTPAGWNCTFPSVGSAPTFTCTNPSFANGASSTFTVVVNADPNIIGINDTTVSTSFSANSGVSDPNNANNNETEVTAYVTPDADMAITVSDSPDPVFPNGNITYTVQVTNNGPDTAPNATMNTFNNGTLKFVSGTTPAGWNCTFPSVGSAPTFTCTNPSFANGASSTFTVVVNADPNIIGINDTTVSTSFSTSSGVSDPNNANNNETEVTAYVTPDADMAVSATDAPDPVSPNGNITYTVQVSNNGPDAAPNATLNVFNNGTLKFVSATVPAGWNCTLPSAGATPTFTCTNPSFANGGNSTFTIVVNADATVIGIFDTTLTTSFSVSSAVSDPNNANNIDNENTAYVTPDADLAVTNSDAPDPVTSGSNLTYTQSIINNGPDAAPNAQFSETLPASVGFQSISAPAGFSCTTPAVGTSGTITCTNASLASGAGGAIVVVVNVIASSGTISNTIVASSPISDPAPSNNSANVLTTILAPVTADLSIMKTTPSDNAAPGATLVYTITLFNNGPDAASNVVVTDPLLPQLLFQSISVPANFNCTTPAVGANGTITCTAATLPANTTSVFQLVVTVAGNASGPIDNTASVTSSTNDNNGGNNAGSAAPVATGGTGTADLAVSKTTQTTTAAPGDTVTYTIAATNNGPGTANDVVVQDALPPSLLFQSITPAAGFTCTTPAVGTNGTITCTGGPLANGASATFTLVTTIAQNASGSFANGVTVGTSDADPAPGNSTSSTTPIVVATADLSISKTTASTQAASGSTITYTISVTNNGPDAATNVVVSDNLPTGLQFVSAVPSQGNCTGTDPFTCILGTLNNGATATITLQALVTATTGTVANTATVTADTDDGNSGNNSSTSPSIPVTGGPATPEAAGIPTLSEWSLIALAALLGLAAMLKMRS